MPLLSRRCLPVAVCGLLLALCASAEVFSVLSDIHYDPLYGASNGYKCTTSAAATLGQAGCDSPKALMESVMSDISTRRNAYTLYAGDWQRHGFAASGLKADALWPDEAAGLAGITTSGSLDKSGQASVVGCVGNNDVVPDYEFQWESSTQTELDARVELLKTSTILTADEATEMKKCGYYAREVSASLRVLSLHSLLWANKLVPAVPDTESDPCGQFAFLESQLSAAKSASQKVVILTHFPTTLDYYTVVSAGKFTDATTDMYWKPRFQTRYYSLVSQYADTVKFQLFGHVHMFTPIAHAASGVPAVILPAVSPIFGNVPSYVEVNFNSDWSVENMRQRFLTNSAWSNGQQVAGALGFPYGFTNISSMHESLTTLLTNDVAWENYLKLHSGGELKMSTFPNGKCESFCRRVTVCSMTNSDYEDVKACVTAAGATTTTTVDPQLNGSIVTSVLILGVSLFVACALILSKVIPMIRSGELSCDKIHFDWRAQLLGATPKTEKRRRQAQQDEIDRHNAQAADTTHTATADDGTAAVEVVDFTDLDRHSGLHPRE